MDLLSIALDDKGIIAQTNYAESGYNTRGLAYLHVHASGLSLLLPDARAAAWLPEMATGRRVLIEPPARAGYSNHVDIVFDDGTDTPFSLCVDKGAQVSAVLRNRDTVLRVYDASGSLKTELPCTVKLPDGGTYINHISTNTDHRRRSPRSEVSDAALQTVSAWLSDMLDGQTRAIWQDRYACRIVRRSGKSVLFAVSRVDGEMQHTDIVHFAVCRHSRDKAKAWAEVGGRGNLPQVPFCAVRLLDSITMADAPHLAMIADFERVMAWAWLERQQS